MLKVNGTPPCFSASFSKGNNFLFSSLVDTTLPNWGLLSKERICSKRSKFLPLRVNPLEKGSRYINDRVIFPESVPYALSMRFQADAPEILYIRVVVWSYISDI